MSIRGGWTHHSDKWGMLTSIYMEDDRKALRLLDSYPPAPIEDQKLALEAIHENLAAGNNRYLASEILHAATFGFSYMALDKEYDETRATDILVAAFEQTKEDSAPGPKTWKSGIVKTIFSAATKSKTNDEKELAIALMEKLHMTDGDLIANIVRSESYPQEWNSTTSLPNFLRGFKPE